jgi:hypothetical protein
MDIDDLDGLYRVYFASDTSLPQGMYEMEHADLVLKGGNLAGLDAGGCLFCGAVTMNASGDAVIIDAVLDPRSGRADMVMAQPDGTFDRLPVLRKAELKILRDGDTISLRGASSIAGRTWKVNATRKAKLGE